MCSTSQFTLWPSGLTAAEVFKQIELELEGLVDAQRKFGTVTALAGAATPHGIAPFDADVLVLPLGQKYSSAQKQGQ
ncbi:hypothetical protein V1264_008001 [Littorina saxatilis]|uniref:Uncharacterized protein n=1 Tax=Littorina saxatilis TaxID=31220 RepID=A0AAN9ATE2_9CAEN